MGHSNFDLDSVPAGPHFIRDAGGLRGWALEQVLVDGHDVTDTPVDLRSGRNLAGVTVVFTDRLTSVTGAVTNQSGQPVTDFTILAFPADSTLWRAQSRQIMTARPDQTGKSQAAGLPQGDYYLTTVDAARAWRVVRTRLPAGPRRGRRTADAECRRHGGAGFSRSRSSRRRAPGVGPRLRREPGESLAGAPEELDHAERDEGRSIRAGV